MGELRQHQPIPLSLDGRGIKGLSQCLTRDQRVIARQSRHTVILALRQYPQGGRVTRVSKTTPIESPSPLMGEESKVRVTQPLTLGSEGEQYTSHHLSHGQPTTPAHVTDCTRTTQSNHSYPNQARHCAACHSRFDSVQHQYHSNESACCLKPHRILLPTY